MHFEKSHWLVSWGNMDTATIGQKTRFYRYKTMRKRKQKTNRQQCFVAKYTAHLPFSVLSALACTTAPVSVTYVECTDGSVKFLH